jgi:hypothetical protein
MWIFLDDERWPAQVTWTPLPKGAEWTIVRTQDEFEATVLAARVPIRHISFDNDLGDGMGEGRFCARWLTDMVMDGKVILDDEFTFTVHSMNVVAAEWIEQYLNQFLLLRPDRVE